MHHASVFNTINWPGFDATMNTIANLPGWELPTDFNFQCTSLKLTNSSIIVKEAFSYRDRVKVPLGVVMASFFA